MVHGDLAVSAVVSHLWVVGLSNFSGLCMCNWNVALCFSWVSSGYSGFPHSRLDVAGLCLSCVYKLPILYMCVCLVMS